MSDALPTLGVALTLDELQHDVALVREAERDVEVQDFRSTALLKGDWQIAAGRAKALFGGHGGRRGIHGPFLGFSLASADPDVRRVIHERLLTALAACEVFGGTHMVVHSPFSIWDHHNEGNWPGVRESVTAAFTQNLAPAVGRAEAIGCTLVIENIEDCDPSARRGLAEAFDSDAVALSLDTGHAHYASTMHGAPSVQAYICDAGARLAHVHLQDSDGSADRHWRPGEGTIAWSEVFAQLGKAATPRGEAPRLILELRHKRELRDAIAHLSSLGVAC